MKKESIELTVKGIALDQESQMPIILLQDKEKKRILPIWIGPFEASAIIIEIEGVQPPRPLTHDLLAQFFIKHKFSMKYMEIYGIFEKKHLARIAYRKGTRLYTMDVRPSDGIALAVRLGSPIYSNPDILQKQAAELSILQNLEFLSSDILYLEPSKFEAPRI